MQRKIRIKRGKRKINIINKQQTSTKRMMMMTTTTMMITTTQTQNICKLNKKIKKNKKKNADKKTQLYTFLCEKKKK